MVTQKVQKRKGVRQVYTEKFLWYNVQDYHGVLGAPAAATEESFMQRARELIRDIFRQTDLVLLALCCIATAFGILMIYSATRYMNTLRLVLVQTGGAVIGIILFFLLSLVDVNELMRKRGWLWLTLFGLGMILLLKSPFGEACDTGNLAWLDFPFLPFMIQPSEIVKLTFTVVLAWQLVWLQENRTLRKVPDVLFLGAHLMMFFLLYYKISSDMGSDLVFVAIFICMCFVAGVSKGWFIGGGLTAALAFYILWEEDVIEDYMKNRFIVVFDHSFHPMEEGWQQTRSLLTLGGGKLTGMGLFKGIQTQSTDSSSLPNRHTDFIFSVIGEELGMVGCVLALAILAAIILRCIYVGRNANNKLDAYICVGVVGMLMFQVLANVGMCLFVMPVIGLTLPFFSYGGTSIVITFAIMGLVSGAHSRSRPDWLRK